MTLRMLLYATRPSAMPYDRGEVVVGDDELGGLAGDVGAPAPHGDADVRRAQGRRVIYAVARDGHEMPRLARRLHEVQLLLRRHPREDAGRADRFPELCRRLRSEVGTGNDLLRRRRKPKLARDRQGRDGMVAGDHPHLDSGPVTLGHSLAHAGPQRIDHADEAEQAQSDRLRGCVCRIDVVWRDALGDRQHA